MSRNFRKPTMSMRGRQIDMDAMRAANESARAIGNARMNARGDILKANGEIEVRRDQIVRDYYNQSNGNQSVSLKPAIPDMFETPAQALSRLTAPKPAVQKVETETDIPTGIVKKRRLIKGDE